MVSKIAEFLFGHSHQMSRVFRIPGVNRGKHYKVCLECGAEFNYSWDEMKLAEEIKPQPQPLQIVFRRRVS